MPRRKKRKHTHSLVHWGPIAYGSKISLTKKMRAINKRGYVIDPDTKKKRKISTPLTIHKLDRW